jgi:hypothetical protein
VPDPEIATAAVTAAAVAAVAMAAAVLNGTLLLPPGELSGPVELPPKEGDTLRNIPSSLADEDWARPSGCREASLVPAGLRFKEPPELEFTLPGGCALGVGRVGLETLDVACNAEPPRTLVAAGGDLAVGVSAEANCKTCCWGGAVCV